MKYCKLMYLYLVKPALQYLSFTYLISSVNGLGHNMSLHICGLRMLSRLYVCIHGCVSITCTKAHFSAMSFYL